MSVTVVCGINWGDEGKGRMVDYLSANASHVVRFQGGNNAGHTVVNEFGTFKLHLVPSGVFRPDITNILGPGTVVDLEALVDEIASLEAGGISIARLLVSHRATICFPFYRDEDEWEEERLGAAAYGSTRRGIAPAYADRHLKKGIQIGSVLHPDYLREQLKRVLAWTNLVASGVYAKPASRTLEEMMRWALHFGGAIRDRITDVERYFAHDVPRDANVLMEAQLGALRDVYHGIYPFTSSSCCLADFAPIGSGSFRANDRVIGVMKAFSTCVGKGPFVTEMNEAEASELREVAYEYGAATGRPRRIGHFDAVASRHGARLQHASHIALTKLDSLSGRARLKICAGYRLGGSVTNDFPINAELERVEPVYEECAGWEGDISGCRSIAELPAAAQNYVKRLEDLVEVRISFVSVGPERSQLIVCE
jgi:adenylosuccinate synthase